ncbi:MAG TPA: MFS transporter [Solirubrobacteraceae bacterium]|nr:MFS transporter [Solirubrobacteraceae bacterium]
MTSHPASSRSPLESPRLRRILGAYSVNRVGTWFGFVALSVGVFDHTHSALAVAALLASGQVLPAFLVPAIVARVEASRGRGLLSALYAVEALATAALVVLLWNFWLPAILLLVAIDGTAALAASALLRAALARTAREQAMATGDPSIAREEFEANVSAAERSANAALNVAFSGTFVLGPAIAGAVVAAAGAATALWIDVASFLICATMLLDLRPHVAEGDGASVRTRLRAAWAHINDVPALRALLLVQGIALVFFESAAPIEVPYAKVALDAGDRGYGALLAAWGVGVVVGSVIFARSSRRSLGVMLSSGTLAVGLAYVGFFAAPTVVIACLAALLGGLGNGVQWASLISAVQRMTPEPLLGRMMGAVESVGALCPAIGLSLGGALVALSSPRTAFLVTGLAAVATTAGFVRVARLGLGAPPIAGGQPEAISLTSEPHWSPYGREAGTVDSILPEEDAPSSVHTPSRTQQAP